MNKLLLTFAFLTSATFYASEIKTYTFPSEEALRASFENQGIDHFANKTNIVKNYANKEISALAIPSIVEFAFSDYAPLLRQTPNGHILFFKIKPLIYAALLQDMEGKREILEKIKRTTTLDKEEMERLEKLLFSK